MHLSIGKVKNKCDLIHLSILKTVAVSRPLSLGREETYCELVCLCVKNIIISHPTTVPAITLLESGMGRMMSGSMSSYLSSLQQHRKSQYTGNDTSGANEDPFPPKSCNYTQYNLLPPNKTEGEMTWLRCFMLSSGTVPFLMTYQVFTDFKLYLKGTRLSVQQVSICFQCRSTHISLLILLQRRQIAFGFPLYILKGL